MKKNNKLKRQNMEILSLQKVIERNTRVIKNYGINLRYSSRYGIHNMYKEFRDVSLCGAVSKLYQEMSGRHQARLDTVHIVRTVEVPSSNILKGIGRSSVLEFNTYKKDVGTIKIKFPVLLKKPISRTKAFRKVVTTSKPLGFSH